jgi:hypothetical protein
MSLIDPPAPRDKALLVARGAACPEAAKDLLGWNAFAPVELVDSDLKIGAQCGERGLLTHFGRQLRQVLWRAPGRFLGHRLSPLVSSSSIGGWSVRPFGQP